MSDNDHSIANPRLLDHVLLAATLVFTEEFRVDHARRRETEQLTDVRSILAARMAVEAEIDELVHRVSRIARALAALPLSDDAQVLLDAYAMLDFRRIHTSLVRIHRHLLTLYPSVTERLIERVRTLARHVEEASEHEDTGTPDAYLWYLDAFLEIGHLVRDEIG